MIVTMRNLIALIILSLTLSSVVDFSHVHESAGAGDDHHVAFLSDPGDSGDESLPDGDLICGHACSHHNGNMSHTALYAEGLADGAGFDMVDETAPPSSFPSISKPPIA